MTRRLAGSVGPSVYHLAMLKGVGLGLAVLVAATACGKTAPKVAKRIYVTSRDSTILLPGTLREVIEGVPGVESVVPEIPVQWRDGEKAVWGIAIEVEELTRKQPAVLGLDEEDAARWARDVDGIAVSRPLATRKGWTVGDSVALVIEGRSAERAAAAEADRFTLRAVYDAPGEQFAIHVPQYRKITGVLDDSVPIYIVGVAGDREMNASVDAITKAVDPSAPQARVIPWNPNAPVDTPGPR